MTADVGQAVGVRSLNDTEKVGESVYVCVKPVAGFGSRGLVGVGCQQEAGHLNLVEALRPSGLRLGVAEVVLTGAPGSALNLCHAPEFASPRYSDQLRQVLGDLRKRSVS